MPIASGEAPWLIAESETVMRLPTKPTWLSTVSRMKKASGFRAWIFSYALRPADTRRLPARHCRITRHAQTAYLESKENPHECPKSRRFDDCARRRWLCERACAPRE